MKNNKYYLISNNIIIGVTCKFEQYLIKNNYCAPKIPKGITLINENVFEKTKYIKEIFIPNTIFDLSIKVFEKFENIIINYNNLYYVSIRKKDLYGNNNKIYKLSSISKYLNKYLEKKDGTLNEIPNWISCIGEFSFKDNKYVKRIILNHEISVFKEAFCNCINLKEIIGSNYIRDYGDGAFKNCSNLKKIEIPVNIINIRSNVFYGCKKLKIDLFNIDVVNINEFNINQRNLYMKNRNDFFKVLIIKKNYYFIDKEKIVKISRKDFNYSNNINKQLGYKYKGKKYFFDNMIVSYALYNKFGYVPYDFITRNIKIDYIENYIKYYDEFEKVILNKCRNISNKKTLNNKNEMVGRLTCYQYEALLKLSIISGFFEDNEAIRKKSINLINNYLLPIDNNKSKLSLNKFKQIFNIIESINVSYNKEFSEYFLFNKSNLNKLINKLLNNYLEYINLLISKCGESNIKYKHNNIYEKSLGLLHDEWLIYRNNNNNKHININNSNNSTVLNFIDWSLTLDQKLSFDNLNINKEIVQLFTPFYNLDNALIKLNEIISNSKNVAPYIFIPNKYLNNNIETFNIANIFSNKILKEIKVSRVKNEKMIYELIKAEESFLCIKKDNIVGKIIDKANPLIAYSNCKMGNCSNVTSIGCEYLYESYYDNSCQPFIIFDNDEAIASFRIDLDKTIGNASINDLEVLSKVKFEYSKENKNKIVYIFDCLIKNFITIYNKHNNVKINRISMGKLSNFDINDILEMKYKTTAHSFYVKTRIVCKPSSINHFIIYERRTI